MQRNHPGRHRKPRPAAAIAARTALSAGAAVAAAVAFAPAASAAPAEPAVSAPNPFPCTGTPFDTLTKSLTGSYCGSTDVSGTSAR